MAGKLVQNTCGKSHRTLELGASNILGGVKITE